MFKQDNERKTDLIDNIKPINENEKYITKVKPRHRKIDSYDKFVDDISKDIFIQNEHRKNKNSTKKLGKINR